MNVFKKFYRDISSKSGDIFLKSFKDIPFLYVCQSVTWLTSLLKLDKYRNISSPDWDIILKFFGDFPGMLVHYFQIILYFFYFCYYISLLTSSLKLEKYRDISGSGSDIFLEFFGDISSMLTRQFTIILNFLYVC